jgi:hypothetical protein
MRHKMFGGCGAVHLIYVVMGHSPMNGASFTVTLSTHTRIVDSNSRTSPGYNATRVSLPPPRIVLDLSATISNDCHR